MAQVEPFYSSRSPVFHICTGCPKARLLPRDTRLLGTGGKSLCLLCASSVSARQC